MAILAAVTLSSVMTNSCISTENDQSDSVVAKLSTYNATLPIPFANDDLLDSVYYDGGSHKAVFNYLVNNDQVSLESLIGDTKSAKAFVIDQLTSSPEALAIYKEIAGYQVEVRTVLLDNRGRVNTQVDLTLDEIKNLRSKATARTDTSRNAMTVRDSLDQLVDSINALCPDSINNKLELTKAQIENNYLVFNYVCNETKNMRIDMMKGDLASWKARADKEINLPTAEFKQVLKLCVSNGLGIKYRYVGKLTKQAEDYSQSAVSLSKITKHPLPEGYEAIKERTTDEKLKKAVNANEGRIY